MKHFVLVFIFALLLGTPVPSAADSIALQRDDHEVRLWNGPHSGLGDLVYTIRLDREGPPSVHKVYTGIDVGRPMLVFNETHVFDSPDTRRPPIYTFDGPRVHLGADNNRPAIYFVHNGRVWSGENNKGQILFTITHFRVYEGPDLTGTILLSSDSDLLRPDVRIDRLIPILLELELRGEATGWRE